MIRSKMILEYYNYPRNKNISPFDAVQADNYFAEAGKITYLGNFEEIGNIATPFDSRNATLTGAFVLNIYKRYALVENGKIMFINEDFDDGHEIGASRYKEKNYVIITDKIHKYKIDSWGTKLLETYSIHTMDGTYNCALWLRLFKTPELAIQYAIDISIDKSMKCIIAQWFADIDRH